MLILKQAENRQKIAFFLSKAVETGIFFLAEAAMKR